MHLVMMTICELIILKFGLTIMGLNEISIAQFLGTYVLVKLFFE
jgi:hypothetical protein